MATTIVTKNGSGAPTDSDLVAGELAVDLTNGRLYTTDLDSGGTVIEIGLNPSGNVDVTGTVTADGLTVDADGNTNPVILTHSNTGPTLRFNNTDQTTADGQQLARIEFSTDDGGTTTDEVYLQLTANGAGGAADFDFMVGDGTPVKRMRIHTGGDISFYEDTGTTAKFFWDASAESLGIGTTSPSNALEVVGNAGNTVARFYNLAAATSLLQFQDTGTTTRPRIGSVGNDLILDTANTERMRIDSSGNVGIGTDSPTGLLHLAAENAHVISKVMASTSGYDAELWLGRNDTRKAIIKAEQISANSDHDLVFFTNGPSADATEKMRLDASGNLLVGTPSQINTSKTNILGTASTNVLGLKTEHNNYLISGFSSTTEVLRVEGDGDVLNQNNTYGALSDERLKSNIVDASSQIDDIMAVQVRSYTLDSTGDTHIGVVAQELESSGMSGLVSEDKDGMKSVKYSVLYMKALKALQEAMTKIEDLEARVATLEGAN